MATTWNADDYALTLPTPVSRDDPAHQSVHDQLVIITDACGGGRTRVKINVTMQSKGQSRTACRGAARSYALDLVVSSLG